MNTPINLNKHRKQKARAEKKAQATENSLKFGLTKAELTKQALASQKNTSYLDGQKRDI